MSTQLVDRLSFIKLVGQNLRFHFKELGKAKSIRVDLPLQSVRTAVAKWGHLSLSHRLSLLLSLSQLLSLLLPLSQLLSHRLSLSLF